MAMLDARRTDQRTNVLATPFWISSRVVGPSGPNADAVKSAETVYFSFPKAGEIYVIHEFVFQVITAITAATTITVGSGTIPLESTTTGGVVTNVDADEYLLAADITLATAGFYGPSTANTSDWLTAAAAKTFAGPRYITGVAAAVPVIYSIATNAGAVAAGAWRVHALISIIPGM